MQKINDAHQIMHVRLLQMGIFDADQRYREIEVRAQIPEPDGHGLPHRISPTFRITVLRCRRCAAPALGCKGRSGTQGGPPGDLSVALALLPPFVPD